MRFNTLVAHLLALAFAAGAAEPPPDMPAEFRADPATVIAAARECAMKRLERRA